MFPASDGLPGVGDRAGVLAWAIMMEREREEGVRLHRTQGGARVDRGTRRSTSSHPQYRLRPAKT